LKTEHLPVLPVAESTAAKTPRKQSDTTISVWELDKSAWRSFTVDSVKSIKQES